MYAAGMKEADTFYCTVCFLHICLVSRVLSFLSGKNQKNQTVLRRPIQVREESSASGGWFRWIAQGSANDECFHRMSNSSKSLCVLHLGSTNATGRT